MDKDSQTFLIIVLALVAVVLVNNGQLFSTSLLEKYDLGDFGMESIKSGSIFCTDAEADGYYQSIHPGSQLYTSVLRQKCISQNQTLITGKYGPWDRAGEVIGANGQPLPMHYDYICDPYCFNTTEANEIIKIDKAIGEFFKGGNDSKYYYCEESLKDRGLNYPDGYFDIIENSTEIKVVCGCPSEETFVDKEGCVKIDYKYNFMKFLERYGFVSGIGLTIIIIALFLILFLRRKS